jgi:hypothetical protein
MPPQDTIYIPSETGTALSLNRPFVTTSGDTVYLPDSFFGTGGYQTWKLVQLQNQQHVKEQ